MAIKIDQWSDVIWYKFIFPKGSPYKHFTLKKTDDAYKITGSSRVSLDSIVYAFLNGQTAESIAQSLPVLILEQVYGAITYYQANRSEIDKYLKNQNPNFKSCVPMPVDYPEKTQTI